MEVLTSQRVISRRRFLALAALSAWGGAAFAQGGDAPVSEYAVKAALLYKFLRYLTWPDGALPGEGEPFRIGVLGKDPFGSTIDATVAGKSILDHPIAVARAAEYEDLPVCPVLFVAASEEKRLEDILDAVGDRPVLIVGDTEGYPERGVMINLVVRDKKVKFQINHGAARRVGIEVDAQLLRLAELVGPDKSESGEG